MFSKTEPELFDYSHGVGIIYFIVRMLCWLAWYKREGAL